MPSKRIIRSNILITFLSLVALGVTFVSQMVLAYYFGAESERDSYFSAMTVPSYIITLFVGSLTVVFLPFYINFRKDHEEAETIKFVSSFFGASVLFLLVVALTGFALSERIVDWIAPGFSESQLVLANGLFKILIFTIVFQCLASLITVFHHVEHRFLWPALSPIIIPLTGLFFVVVFHGYGIISLAVGTLLGSIIAMAVLVPQLVKKSSLSHVISFRNEHTKTVIKLAMPLLAAGAIYRLTTIIERLMASQLPEGSISYLGYSNQLYLAMATIATGSIATTFYPLLATSWAEQQPIEFRTLLSKGIKLILLITLPVAAIIVVLSPQLVQILFERGAFDSEATRGVSTCLTLLMGAFIFGSLGNLLMKVFYITNKTMVISTICILEVIVYGITGYFLSSYYSYSGLALTLTLSTGFTIALTVFFLIRWKYLSPSNLYVDVIKLLLSAIVCGLVTQLVFRLLGSFQMLISSGLSVFGGVLSYLLMVTYVFRFRDPAVLYKEVKTYF